MIPPSNYGTSGFTEKVAETDSSNDTLIIVSLADSTLVVFTYSNTQSELEKIEM